MSFRGPPPITLLERPHLLAMGARLAELRRAADLTQGALAARVGISASHVGAIERGRTRTRRTTLLQITRSLDPETAEQVTAELVELAGPGLARESRSTRILGQMLDEAETIGREAAVDRYLERLTGKRSLRRRLAELPADNPAAQAGRQLLNGIDAAVEAQSGSTQDQEEP